MGINKREETPVKGARPTSAVVSRAQCRQPAASNQRVSACQWACSARLGSAQARLGSGSVSAAEAGRRGTATAAPSIFPVMASAKHPRSGFHQQHCA
ncbi:hypothetical protein Q5P01_022825 [Channa striata]|uniref:Uncharacterized protein n=1 Tax=Channa striata TaxID=64152 RepID=A0AA88S7D9_CHASR|nr:hypothetical protein Q5P01_022825 [Channa striata]